MAVCCATDCITTSPPTSEEALSDLLPVLHSNLLVDQRLEPFQTNGTDAAAGQIRTVFLLPTGHHPPRLGSCFLLLLLLLLLL
jgi:hypothetical protein